MSAGNPAGRPDPEPETFRVLVLAGVCFGVR